MEGKTEQRQSGGAYSSVIDGWPHIIHGADYNPDQWLKYPDILQEDMRLMKLANMNSATIGIFAWKALEPEEGKYTLEWLDQVMERMAEHGMKVILATPSGARPYWMDRDHPEVLRVSRERVRNLHGKRHNHCYTAPYYREKVREMNTMLAKRYGNHAALAMWHVSNEYGGECHCELCQQAFRQWLRKKYNNDIEALNEQWWTSFWSHRFSDFEEIDSPSFRGEEFIHGMNLDWRRFVSQQTADFFRNEVEALKKVTPDIPVTTNLMHLYSGLNVWDIAPYADLVSWDSYPEWGNPNTKDWKIAREVSFMHDVMSSLKQGRPFFLMESTPSLVNWKDVNKLKKPGVHELSAMQAIAHGSDSVQYFQWRKGRGASEKLHGAVVDHYGKEDTRVFREVSALGKRLRELDEIVGTAGNGEAAVLFDWENWWAIDDMQGFSRQKRYPETCLSHYEAFWKLGIPVDIICADSELSSYKIVSAPFLYMVKEGMGARLKEYVRQGGTLILTCGTGYVNENDLCYLGGFPGDGLQELTGVWAEEVDALFAGETNEIRIEMDKMRSTDLCCTYMCSTYCERIHPLGQCEVIGTYGKDFYRETPVVTRNRYGKGICCYIASVPEQKFLDDFYRNLVSGSELRQIAWDNLPEGVTVQRRFNDNWEYAFLLNFSHQKQTVKLPEKRVFTEVPSQTCCGKEVVLEDNGYCILKSRRCL